MSKIMVVEDDASLREIYGIRITAEGYDVVSAGDGEEALAVAVREKPDLILSDVMMPKISGFDMLDILRTTPETANIKVVMMTALSSEDQRQRGERLGADRYLVKSQVGIEDVINTIHEVLGDRPSATPAPQPNQPLAEQPAMPPKMSAQPAEQPPVQTSVEPASIPQPEAIQSKAMQPTVPEMPAEAPATPASIPETPAPTNPQVENEQPPVSPAQ